ncbi:MAG: DUF5658 family protein [Acidobacteriota bacterium]
MPYLEVFAYLQLLDFLTTLVALRLGGQEMSPFIRWLMGWGPVTGVALAKVGAFLLAGVCIWLRRERILRWCNYWFAALVLWNLSMILRALTVT